jgi:hypothetical protein
VGSGEGETPEDRLGWDSAKIGSQSPSRAT